MLNYLLFLLLFSNHIDLPYAQTSASESDDTSEELRNAPANHAIPYSEHENPPEPPTQPKYGAPGEWAKPGKNIPLEFVPTMTYAQVRKTTTVKHVPQSEALLDATTDEERANAPRLKAVVTDKKVNTVYTEEGYEDAAYDHAGHVRDAAFDGAYVKNLKTEDTLNHASTAVDSAEAGGSYESYEDQTEATKIEPKSKNIKKYQPDGFQRVDDAGDTVQIFLRTQTSNLEKDLKREADKVASLAETDVPENLRDLTGTTAHPGNYTSPAKKDVKRIFVSTSIEEPPDKKVNSTERPTFHPTPESFNSAFMRYADTSSKIYPKYEDTTPKIYPRYQDFVQGLYTTTSKPSSNYGPLFWDYYETKSLNPLPLAATSVDSSSSLSRASTIHSTEEFDENERYPTLSKVYETWKRQGFEPSVPSGEEITESSPSDEVVHRRRGSGSVEYPSSQSSEIIEESAGATDYPRYESPEISEATSEMRYSKLTSQRVKAGSSEESPRSRSPVIKDAYSADYSRLNLPQVIRNLGTTQYARLASPQVVREISSTEYPRLTSPIIIRETSATEYPGLKSPQIREITSTEYPRLKSGEAVSATTIAALQVPSTAPRRPIYTVIIRAPSKPCAEDSTGSKAKKSTSNYAILSHLTNSVNPKLINTEAVSNVSVVKPPAVPPLGQVTYADYLLDTYGKFEGPAVSEESGSAEETDRDSVENPPSVPVTRYQPRPRQNRFLPILSWLPRVVPPKLPPPSKMLPPSPVSRSQYAEYSAMRRADADLPEKQRQSDAYTYQPVFQVSKGVTKRQADNEKVLSNDKKTLTELLLDQGVAVKSHVRKKRSVDDIFNDAPRIVQEVVDREIQMRFPDESDASRENSGEKEKVVIDVPQFDFSEVLRDIENHENFKAQYKLQKNQTVDNAKYPFYNQLPTNSALRYIVNPLQVPRKTLGGMEFYESRDQYLECEEVNSDLSQVAEDAPVNNRGPKTDVPRLHGLGDKLTCYKAKYFDKNPLDNPLFLEKRVDSPQPPAELNPQRFQNQLPNESSEPEARVHLRLTRKPEASDLYRSENKRDPIVGQSRSKSNHTSKQKVAKGRQKMKNSINTPFSTPHQKEVYKDVMGTIKNLAGAQSDRLPSNRAKENQLIKSRPFNFYIENMRPPVPSWQYKVIPYQANNVIHRTPFYLKLQPSQTIGHHKVKIHKRSVNTGFNSEGKESQNYLNNWTSSKLAADPNVVISTSIASTVPPLDDATKLTKKPIYTIKDRIRFSRPRGTVRWGKFTNSSTATVDTRRNEPRYNSHDEVPKNTNATYFEDSTTVTSLKVTDGGTNKENDIMKKVYQVHEDIDEGPTEASEIIDLKKLLSDKTRENKKENRKASESEEGSSYVTGELRDSDEKQQRATDSRQTDKQNGKNQTEESLEEKSSKSGNDESFEKSNGEKSSKSATDESLEKESEEKSSSKVTDTEEDFVRFNDRPKSPAENFYDSKYANLGPRVNKPAFHHPSFAPPSSEKREKKHESQEDDSDDDKNSSASKYSSFPWDEFEEETSAESRAAEYYLGRREYPWERRERLARQYKIYGKKDKKNRMKNDDFDNFSSEDDETDQESSETQHYYKVVYPWEHLDSPYGKSDSHESSWSPEMFDSESSDYKYTRSHDKTHKKSQQPGADVERIAKSILSFVNENADEFGKSKSFSTTTSTPQIPPTSVTSPPKRETTTPISEITTTTKTARYTIKPRTSRPLGIKGVTQKSSHKRSSRGPVESESAISEITSRPNAYTLKRRRQMTKNHISNRDTVQKSRRPPRKSTSTTTTTTTKTVEIPKRHLYFLHSKNLKKFPTFKTKQNGTSPMRTIEHRSSVSTEEIITKTLFPKPNGQNFSTKADNSMQKSEHVQKVSIVTKETPQHIYRQEHIDKDGVKGMFITITPNNNTNRSPSFDHDAFMGDIDLDDDMMGKMGSHLHVATREPMAAEDTHHPDPYFLASLLRQVAPTVFDSTEESGKFTEDADNSNVKKIKVKYVKEPDQRLYSYVEDIN